MAPRSTFAPGLNRPVAWAPTDDTGRTRGADPGTIFSAGRQWTPFGFIALGHTLSINPATGGFVVSVNDASIPYQRIPLRVTRLLDIQEQYAQVSFLKDHPNVDPRFHFFSNWQLHTESQVSATWNHAFPELLINDGDGESTLFYREYMDFGINETDAASVESTLRSYGVPGRTLDALGWQFTSFDLLLRAKRGDFSILTGRFLGETMVDAVDLRLWRFEPVTGMGYRYTSEFAYQQFIDADGLREVTVPSLLTQTVDALGHSVTFRPAGTTPPYRTYLIADATGRSFRLELSQFVTYLDGDKPGALVKSYVISRVIDQTRTAQNIIDYVYDNNQRLVEVHYPGHAGGAARVVRYTYDSNGNLNGITDPVGDSFSFEYTEDLLDSDDRLNPRLKLSRITDNEGNSISYHYDHPHRQVTVTFTGADGKASSGVFEYVEDFDDTGQRFITSQIVQVTRGYSGNQTVVTSFEYSDDGRYLVHGISDPLGNTYNFEYNSFNQMTASVDPIGHRTQVSYDVSPSPTPANPNRYDTIGSQEQNTDVDGNLFPVNSRSTYLTYDALSSNDPADTSQSTHRVASRTNELGNTSTYGYDDEGNTNPLQPTTVTDPMGKQTLRNYDATGALTSQTDATGSNWGWLCNAQGQLVVATDANRFKRYWVYDPGSMWLTDATDALGTGPGDPAHSVHSDWNDAGQRVKDTDPVGDITEYAYFRNKRLRSITRYNPTPRVISFAYDCAGALTNIVDPVGHSTVFQIDEAGRIYETFRDDPINPNIRFVMDAAGRITGLTNRNGQTSRYAYDALGRMTTIQEPNWPAANPVNTGKTVTIKYDYLGHRLQVVDSQLPSPSKYHYDPAGNQLDRTDSFGQLLNYQYDARNDLVHVYDGSGIIDLQFVRDGAGHLSSVTDSSALDPSRQFRYFRTDGALVDNLYRIEFDASGISKTLEYDPNRRLTQIAHLKSGGPLLRFGYNYRADGLISRATGDHTGNYNYDGTKQIINETDSGVQDAYDGAGNRLWRAAAPPAPAQQNVYDAENKLTNSPATRTVFAYDANGNRLSRARVASVSNYTYDSANRLMRVQSAGKTVDYLYDIDGRLLQRAITPGGSAQVERFRYANRSILAIVDGNARLKSLFTRDDEGRLLRRRTSSRIHPTPSADPHSLFYFTDGLGSVASLVDWDGRNLLRIDYDSWGNDTASSKLEETFRYRSGLHDGSTELLNFGARWYDPEFGRWLSQDPLLVHQISGGEDLAPNYTELVNLYAYVRNNSLTFYDPFGLGAVLPTGWPPPPGWKGGYKWKNDGDRLIDPDGEPWHWHPEDETHNEHWDKGTGRDKQRLDKDGKDLGPDAFKPDEPKDEASDEDKSEDGESAKRVFGGAAVGVGAIIVWEVVKWVVAAVAAPETLGGSLAAAAVMP